MKTLDNLTYKDEPAADLYQRRVYLLSICTLLGGVASTTHPAYKKRGEKPATRFRGLFFLFLF